MKWVTWEQVGVDRMACALLIKKFIDKDAEFLFVPTDQVEERVSTCSSIRPFAWYRVAADGALQHRRAGWRAGGAEPDGALLPPALRRVDQVSDTSATGYLLLKTVGPNEYRDDYERDFQFTLSVEDGSWKITQIGRCLADGCLPDTTSIVP